jgi:hypothetical protein
LVESESSGNPALDPQVSLIVYIFFFSIGFGPLAWSINAEIFPREAKNMGSSIATRWVASGQFFKRILSLRKSLCLTNSGA